MEISVRDISLKYRHDIAFFIYVLMHEAWPIYDHVLKVNGIVLKERPKLRLKKPKLRSFWRDARQNPQAKGRKKPVPVYKVDGVYYPAGGAKRISIAYALGTKKIPVRIIGNELPESSIVIVGKHRALNGISPNMEQILLTRDRILGKLRGSKFGTYHGIPELAIKGSRCKPAKRLKSCVIQGNVLDVGCNIGMISLECAKKASLVHGIDPLIPNAEVATELKDFYNVNNAEFFNQSFNDFHSSCKTKYDLILALAVHNWVDCSVEEFFQKMKSLLTKNGIILFESHKGQPERRIRASVVNAGFKTRLYPSDQPRRFMLKCTQT